jgi:Ca2+/Na+ antiporter
MASYLDNKHSPTSACFTDYTARLFCILLEKLFSWSLMGVVWELVLTLFLYFLFLSVSFKTNTQLGNAVINDIRELVDQTKNSRSDCTRTTLSVIAASTSGLNVQKKHKKSLIATKIGLPLKRRELFGSIQKMYANFLISSEIQSFLVFLPIKVQHDFSEVKVCVRTRFPVDSRFNGRPIFFASKDFLCSFCTFKPLVLAAITLNVVLAQSKRKYRNKVKTNSQTTPH